MTPEQFAEIILEGDVDKLIASVASFDEKHRRKLAKMAARIENSTYTGIHNNPDKELLAEFRQRLGGRCRPNRDVCILALAAVGSFAQVKSLFRHGTGMLQDALLQILIDRRPDWIDRWIEARLSSDMSHFIEWTFLRTLIRAGVCKKPATDAYWRWMAHAALHHSWHTRTPLSKMLLEDTDVLEDIWRFFEVETGALWSGSTDEDATSNRESWPAALVDLSQRGHLNRQRLLDASLMALSTGFVNYVLTTYTRFFERMQPTVDEVACRQPVLFDLLANPASHVVGFALEQVAELARAGRLDGEAFLNAMPSVFQTRSKGQPIAALRTAEQTVKRSPELLPHAVAGLLEALAHPAADVQKKAIGLMEAWAARLHSDHATAIRERIEELAPSVRARAEAVADKLSPPSTQESNVSIPIDHFAAELAELTAAAEDLPPRWRELAGVNEAIAALGSGNMPAPLKLDLMAVPVLTGVQPIVPIGSVEELIDAVAHAVETIESADEVERILDGLSRLCDRRPDDFQQRTGPLVKRLEESRMDFGMGGLATDAMVPESMRQLLMLWLRGETPPPRYSDHGRVAIDQFFDGRLKELIQRASAGCAAPMLSAPTHQGGWIDPRILVQRFTALSESGIEPGECDVIQSLLRLAPDGRTEALAVDLRGHIGRLVRWALGGSDGPDKKDNPHASLWLAAGRVRQPSADLTALVALGIPENLPDAVTHAAYEWHSRRTDDEETRTMHYGRTRPIKILEHPSASFDTCRATWPTVALHDRKSDAMSVRGWRIAALAQVWPLCLDPFFAQAAYALSDRLDHPASTLELNHSYLPPLLEPDRSWSEMAALSVWLGLVGKDADARTAALDVLIESVSDGRATPDQMGDVLSKLQRGGWLKLNRAADALGEAARLSPLHAWFAAETLQGFLSRLEEMPRDVHFVHSLLHELMVDLGMALGPQARSRIEGITGSSKTAKAASALRALVPRSPSPKLLRAGLQVLEGRISRARRWATSGHSAGGKKS